jgi:hypothetical protein
VAEKIEYMVTMSSVRRRFCMCAVALALSLKAIIPNGSVSEGSSTADASPLARRGLGAGSTNQDELARQIAMGGLADNHELSLKVKENVDFLLTPALLVQEALSVDIVVTYPNE